MRPKRGSWCITLPVDEGHSLLVSFYFEEGKWGLVEATLFRGRGRSSADENGDRVAAGRRVCAEAMAVVGALLGAMDKSARPTSIDLIVRTLAADLGG
jgi:hypothetical protein